MEALPRFIQRQQIDPTGLRDAVELPYGLTVSHVASAMDNVLDYIHHINRYSIDRNFERLEELMLGNTYSGFLSELIVKAVARACPVLERNTLVGGHPDLLPRGIYPNNRVLRGEEGIEVKVSLQPGGWQGHNPEEGWVMVFQISVDRLTLPVTARQPLQFEKVMIARLTREHWGFSGRSGTSRRTPTASILQTGTALLHVNPIYERPGYVRRWVRGDSSAIRP